MVEIIPKPAEKTSLWLNILFYFSLILLLVSISSYFVLDYFQKESFKRVQDLEKTLAEEKTPAQIALEKEVFDYQKKIKDFSHLLQARQLSLNFFDFFERTIHPKVWFSEISLDPEIPQVIVSGQAETFWILGQQFLIFQKEPLIKNVNLSDILIGEEGKIEFTFTLSLDPKIFTPPLF